jgi:23S rRNA pseudouridine2605 synthase
VRVNGSPATELGVKVDPERDRVEVDGQVVRPAPRLWVAVHKPAGVVSTRRDPEGRPTLYDALPVEYRALFYVGRLDRDSEGLMLLTNDGETANRLQHPRYEVEREYEAEVDGRLTRGNLARLLHGVLLEDGLARAADVAVLARAAPGTSRVRVVMREGRKREVRRMLELLGHPVRRLARVRYGPIRLGDLPPGGWRRLTRAEVERLQAAGGHEPG